MEIFIIIAICILIIGLVLLAYYGVFSQLNISLESCGGETVVYQNVIGDYRQTGVIMDKIYYSLLNDYNIETFKGYGKYFDNPKEVEKEQLRSEAGCIIETKDIEKLDSLPNDLNVKILPTDRYIVAEFPYKGKVSVVFSILKVYPSLNKFAINNSFDYNGAVAEIYDVPNKKISYRKDISEK